MKIHAFILAGYLVMTAMSSIWGQTLSISKLDYDIRDGLPGMQVMSLHQDSRGRIVIGTKVGACIYDGKEFHSYKTKLPLEVYTEVHQIVERSDQTLWFSTSDGILSYDGTTTQTLPHSDSLDTRDKFIKGRADILYLINLQKNSKGQDDHQLYKVEDTSFYLWSEIHEELAKLDAVPIGISYARELNHLVLIYKKRASKKTVYVALLNETNNTVATIAQCNSFEGLTKGKNGHVYMLCEQSIFKVKEDGLELVVQLPNKEAVYHSFLAVNDSLFYGGGARRAELCKIEIEQEGIPRITNMGVSFTLLNTILLDNDGRLWLGEEVGLSMIPNEAFWEYPYQGGVKGVWSIAQDGNNDLWFASYGYGLSKYHYEEDSFEVIDLDKRGNLAKTGARYMYFGSMSDSNGDVYFPMEKGGIKYDVAQDKLLELNNDRFRKPTMYAYDV